MPDTPYIDPSIVGFNHQDALDLKVDTYRRLSSVLMPDSPAIGPEYGNNLSNLESGNNPNFPVKSIDVGQALISPDPVIKSYGQQAVMQEMQKIPEYKYDLGRSIESPYNDISKKFMGKEFGFSALRDNEDFYYRNDYMQDGWFKRNIIMNPLRFIGRTIVPAVLKLGEGLGYLKSMITSIGSDNYWADVADNAMSKWLEEQEQTFKDQVIPIYHQAGFDQKGFFSQLGDWSFWNEQVADGVAFMASAAIPGMGFAKLGTVGALATGAEELAAGADAVNWFGRAFSATTKFGRMASSVGMGSPAQLMSWTFNTAMESAMEGSQVFKDSMANMKQLRARGIGEFANMSDDDIRSKAGHLAANTVGSNFMVLGLSNAWENTLFFAPFKNAAPALKIGDDWLASASKRGLARLPFYGKIAAEGVLAEGLWEENAQLAIQRMNTIDDKGKFKSDETGLWGFARQLGKQTVGAFSGTDPEAMSNIGVGGLIGIAGGGVFAKIAGERRELLKQIDEAVDRSKTMRNNVFNLLDIYKKDDNNNIVFDKNMPVVDEKKVEERRDAISSIFEKLTITNNGKALSLKDLSTSPRAVDMYTKKILGEYISSLYNLGMKGLSEKFASLTPEQAAVFGIQDAQVNEKAGELGVFAKQAEKEVARSVSQDFTRPKGISDKDFVMRRDAARSILTSMRIDNTILSDFISKEEGDMLKNLNDARRVGDGGLSKTSLSSFPVEQINSLKYQLDGTMRVIQSPDFKEQLSQTEQQYHIDRKAALEKQINDFEKDNAMFLEEARKDSKGMWIAQHRNADGSLTDIVSDKDDTIITSNRRRANYTNSIERNNWADKMLSSDNWHDFYEKMKTTPAIEKLKATIAAEQQAFKESVFGKYAESKPGDFRALVRIAGKLVEGRTDFSQEELQLQQNYAKLLEELLPVYEQAITNETKNTLLRKLDTVKKMRDTLLSSIFEKKYKLENLLVSAETLTEQLLNNVKDGKLDMEKMQLLVQSVQSQIDELEDQVTKDENYLEDLDRKIAILEQEAEVGDYQGIRNAINELGKEKVWVEEQIAEKKSLLAKLVDLIKSLTNIAYKLFARVTGASTDRYGRSTPIYSKYFENRAAFERNLAKGRLEAVEAFQEIGLRAIDRNELERELQKLEDVYTEVKDKMAKWQSIIDETEAAVLAGFDEQLKALTRKPQVIQSSTEEMATTESFGDEFAGDPPSNMSMGLDSDWDGPDYIRPLVTKFLTSTFTDRRVFDSDGNVIGSDYSSMLPSEKDHFKLMDYLTSSKNRAEIKKKLGKGKLKIIAVTRNNIEELGLKDLLYTNENGVDQTQYWEDKDTATARIDFVHVIEEKGKLYFVDSELNRLGTIDKIAEKDKTKIVRTTMRATEFSDRELSQYDVQYPDTKDGKMHPAKKKALEYALEIRKKILRNSEKFNIEEPTGIYSFDITRGVPVRTKTVGNTTTHNPVTDVLISEADINGQTVIVSTTGSYLLNDNRVDLPLGRAFIKTNGEFEKLHYVDNNRLDDATINTILHIFEKLSASYVAKVEEVMAKKLNGKKLIDLPVSERLAIVLAFNKVNKGSFNKLYMKYLKNVVFFNILKKGEKPHPNKIFLKGTSIHFGRDTAIDMVTGGFVGNLAATDFLSRVHHNIVWYANTANANKPFTEYYMDGEEVKDRTWKTYNHYLLSSKFPDGTKRTYIPVTTQIHTAEQAKTEENTPPTPYTSQSIILGVSYGEAVPKKNAKNKTKQKKEVFEDDDIPDEITDDDFGEETDVNEMLAGTKKKGTKKSTKPTKKAAEEEEGPNLQDQLRARRAARKAKLEKLEKEEEESTEESTTEEAPVTKGGVKLPRNPRLRELRLMRMKQEEEERGEGTVTKDTEPEEDFGEETTFFSDEDENIGSPFRKVTSGYFQTEEDLDEKIAYVKKVLPQFSVNRLKNIIQLSPTEQAFGAFIDDAIHIWEGAEVGSIYHEMFEGVANKILSNYEWNSIMKEFKSRKGSFVERETGQTIAYNKATPQQAKEEIAEEFRTFKMTGKVFEGQKNTRTFFQVILDFIKSLFQNRVTIEGVFRDISEGNMANRSVRAKNRFFSNYRKSYPFNYRSYNQFLDGFTAFMFQDLFESTDSIVVLDEVGDIDSAVYERVRDRIKKMYLDIMDEFESGAFPTNTPDKVLNEKNKQRKKAFEKIQEQWDILNTKENWGDFVRNHKFRIRKFGMKFDEEYKVPSEDEDLSNRNDYTNSGFSASNKNSASKSIRFLMASIMKTGVVKGVDGRYVTGSNPLLPNLGIKPSESRLPQLENYDRLMAMISDKFSNLNDMDLIEKKMRDLAGITRLEEAAPEDQNDIAKEFSSDEAAFSILYMRLFRPKDIISQDAMWNLRTKFLAYTSKQTPTPRVLMLNEGTGIAIINATQRGAFEKFHNRMQNAISKHVGDFFNIKTDKDKVKKYTPKEQKHDLLLRYFISEDKEDKIRRAEFNKFLRFLGLYNGKTKKGVLTPEFVSKLKEEDYETYKELSRALLDIATRIESVEPFSGKVTTDKLEIFGYTQTILDILEKLDSSQQEKLMTHLDGENNARQNYIPPSFTSRILSEMSNVETLGELIQAFPQLGQHVFFQNGEYVTDSIILNRAFNPDGTRKEKILTSLEYIDGIKSYDDEAGEFKKTAKLEYHQRLGLQFVLGMSGYWNALTADSETEWLFRMGELIPLEYTMSDETGNSKLSDVAAEFYIPKLVTEIRAALDFKGKHKQMNAEHIDIKRKIGTSLRFFKDILQYKDGKRGKVSAELIDKIHKAIDAGTQPSIIIKDNKKAILSAIKGYIQNSTTDLFNNMLEHRVILERETSEGANVFTLKHMPNELANKFNTDAMSLTEVRDMLTYFTVNSHMANIEQFRLVYGDPAQYKDWEKRVKSLFGPVEQAYYDRTGVFNTWLNTNKNMATFEDESIEIPEGDMFRTTFKNSLTARTIDDFETKNPELLNTLSDLLLSFKAYEDTNETDGQSIASLQAIRHLMIKAGWRWTKEFEIFFQYDSALARQELSRSGDYVYTSESLRALDARIVDRYKDDPPIEGPSPLKTLMPSVREDGTQDLIKHSVYGNSWQIARTHPELRQLYIDMLKRGDDMLNFVSTQKIGATLDNQNRITSHYQRVGESINPFERTDLDGVGNLPYELSFRTIGIQVETQTGGRTRLGTQLTKDIYLNLMPNGIPTDWAEENAELTDSERTEKWASLSEEEKSKSKNYRLVQNTIRSLEKLKDKSVMDAFDRMGIDYSFENGQFTYSAVDLVKLQQFIMDEMTRLEIDDNVIDGLELTADKQEFLHPSESLPSYNSISNLIWAVSDKSISSLKLNGVPYIQVSSGFFLSGQREATYKENGKWIRVTNREDFDRLQKEGKKMFLTSSDLKFYTLEKDGKEIQAMEVKVPHIYKKRINEKRRAMGLEALSDEKLLEWLNKPENSKLLEGVGFRIPTQATSSIEFFKIKEFLPESFGKAIVVPSDITAKAGSDFDVDKLNTYLNNWRMGKDGMPYYEEIDTSTDVDGRYITYIRDHVERNQKDIFAEMRKSQEYFERGDNIAAARALIGLESENIDDAKTRVDEEYGMGKKLFSRLPLGLKQSYWLRENALVTKGATFIEKLASYDNFTQEWIQRIEAQGSITVTAIHTNRKTGEMTYEDDVITRDDIPALEAMISNYRDVVKQIGLKEQAFDKLKDTIAKYQQKKIEENKAFDLAMSEVIADGMKLLSREKFSSLPIHLQNSRGAVENKYFESIRDILKQPERFAQLLSPNDMSNIKQNRDTVQKALDKNYKSDEKKELNYSNFMDINYLSDKRNSFIRGKYDIAIFAVNMTGHANAQISGLGITEGQVRPEDEAVMEAVDWDISLPFEEAPLLTVNGWKYIPLGQEKSTDGRYVMDKISGYINGAVDVAKDPVIIEMGMHSSVANIYMLLERAGIEGEHIALFLMQPSIREYMKEAIHWRNREFGNTEFEWLKEAKLAVLKKFSWDDTKYEQHHFTTEEMIAMIRKDKEMRDERKVAEEARREGKPVPKITKEWTNDEKRLQWLAFVNFMKMEIFANNLNDARTSSNHDTAKMRSMHAINRKDLILERTYEGNMIMSPTQDGFKNGAEALRTSGFIQKTIELLKTFNSVFADSNLFALQNENPREILLNVARRIYRGNIYMREEDFENIMKEYDAAVIDTLLNNYARIGGIQLTKLKHDFFSKTIAGKKNPNNLHDRLEAITENSKYDTFVKNNFLLQNLVINDDQNLGIYTLGLDTTFSREDILSRNLLIDAWRELIESNNEELASFGESLIYASIIQYGVRPQRETLVPFIPLEYYSDISAPVIEMINEADLTHFDEEVIRENAYKKNFIKQVVPRAMTFVSEQGKLNTLWINRKEEPRLIERVYVRNLPTPQLRKIIGEAAIAERYIAETGKNVPQEGISAAEFRKLFKDEIDEINMRMVSRPVFLWQGFMQEEDEDATRFLERAPEYVAVRMVRPEYVTTEEVETRNGPDIKRVVKDSVYKMIAKRDNSWSFIQVYKLVGVDGTKPSVVHASVVKSGKNKGKNSVSLLYKPVNSYGARGFNEVANLNVDDNGNVIGSVSILKSNINIKEQDDEEITQLLRDNPTPLIKFMRRSKYKVKTEQVEAVAPSERVKRKLNVTAGKEINEGYSWKRQSKNGYEVSSKGDKRFSAFFAKLQKGTVIDLPGKPNYVLEKDATIEEIYQIGIKGYPSVNKGKGKASLNPMTRMQQYGYYKALWETWAEDNPEAMKDLAQKAKGKALTDQFANTDINQARALSEILNKSNWETESNEKISPALPPNPISTDMDEIRSQVIAKMKEAQEGESAEKWLPKEIAKVKLATQFIGEGIGSTGKYATAWGDLANTGTYSPDDIVMLAANGKRNGAIRPVIDGVLQGEYANIDKAIEAGAHFVADTEEHLRKTASYNLGEIALAEYLEENGYVRTTVAGTGYWSPTREPIEPTCG